MKKLFFLFITFFLLASFVNAWYCSDTDEAQPIPVEKEVFVERNHLTNLNYAGNNYEFYVLGGNPDDSTAILRINSLAMTVHQGRYYRFDNLTVYITNIVTDPTGNDYVSITLIAKEVYPWGNDGLLNGVSTGYLDDGMGLNAGCTGTKVMTGEHDYEFYYKDVTCNDYCRNDGSQIEYYCNTNPVMESYIEYVLIENSNECTNEVPEFGLIAGAVALIGALTIFIVRRRH